MDVSHLYPETTFSDVMKYLKAEYNEYFLIEHIRTKFNDYSSFKIVAPMFLKNTLLEKSSWKANVYVHPFYMKDRVLLVCFSLFIKCVFLYYNHSISELHLLIGMVSKHLTLPIKSYVDFLILFFFMNYGYNQMNCHIFPI